MGDEQEGVEVPSLGKDNPSLGTVKAAESQKPTPGADQD